MEAVIKATDQQVSRFWVNYEQILRSFRVPEKAIPWYQKHIQAFIGDFPNTRLRNQTSENILNWLENVSRNPGIEEWQIRQKVDALRLLFSHMLQLPWASDFDWEIWSSGAITLETDHPTVARTYEMIDKAVKENHNFLGKSSPNLYRKFLVAMRLPEYSSNTEKSYLNWINRFLRFHEKTPLDDLAEPDVAAFLEYLAIRRYVSGATQSQALNAIVFFFTHVLEKPLGKIGPFKRPKKPKRIPTVLSPAEVSQLFSKTHGMTSLMIRLMYGTDMRVMECVRLRILDLDFSYKQIVIRGSKGKKDRVVPMPERLIDELQYQITRTRRIHDKDLEAGLGSVFMPDALARKYPNAAKEFRWHPVRGI